MLPGSGSGGILSLLLGGSKRCCAAIEAYPNATSDVWSLERFYSSLRKLEFVRARFQDLPRKCFKGGIVGAEAPTLLVVRKTIST